MAEPQRIDLGEVVTRCKPPVPWEEGDNIPWHEPGFSERMLKEHLSQDHDMASRRSAVIDRHVEWIDGLLQGPSRILDLGCGPGLYSQRLTDLGHRCTGIDYSPASISYALERAREANAAIAYRHEDLRRAEFGDGFDLVMLLFGELNVFPPEDARGILERAQAALRSGGKLLLECHTYEAVQARGLGKTSWSSDAHGLFSPQPHLLLEENFWDCERCTSTTRYFVVDAASGSVARHASSMQAYTADGYLRRLGECGYDDIEELPSLTGSEAGLQEGLLVIVAGKR